MQKIVCISDTHWKYDNIICPECDILIHAGDLQAFNRKELNYFCNWIDKQNARYKVIIAGNHDKYIYENNEKARTILNKHCIYLENDLININGLKIYGTPITPIYGKWYFMESDEERKNTFSKIPIDIDILITHSPIYGIGDLMINSQRVGDKILLQQIKRLKNLKYHIFGHIHESYGVYGNKINCSICNFNYEIKNKPVELII